MEPQKYDLLLPVMELSIRLGCRCEKARKKPPNGRFREYHFICQRMCPSIHMLGNAKYDCRNSRYKYGSFCLGQMVHILTRDTLLFLHIGMECLKCQLNNFELISNTFRG